MKTSSNEDGYPLQSRKYYFSLNVNRVFRTKALLYYHWEIGSVYIPVLTVFGLPVFWVRCNYLFTEEFFKQLFPDVSIKDDIDNIIGRYELDVEGVLTIADGKPGIYGSRINFEVRKIHSIQIPNRIFYIYAATLGSLFCR
jgi:hypothetical protein